MLLAKTLICVFHSLWQFWTFSPTSGRTTAQILSTSVQLHPWVLLVSLPSKNSFAFLLISFWFHTFFKFTLGSCFPYFLFILVSRETSPKSHHQSSFSHKIQHGNLTVTSNTQTRWSVKLCVGQRCHGSVYLSFSDFEKYIRSRSDLDI